MSITKGNRSELMLYNEAMKNFYYLHDIFIDDLFIRIFIYYLWLYY